MLRPFSLLGLALVTSSFMACVVTSSSDNTGGDGGSGAAGASGGSGATGGESTTGGTGGTGATGGAGGSGGSGGGACVDHVGTGVAVSECDGVVGGITSCGAEGAPVAELICERGNTIYSPGAWENLLTCLDAIPDDQQSACGANAETLAGNCVDKMYADACSNADAVTLCNGAKAACDEAQDATFNLADCIEDNNPFGTAGLAEWQTCFDALSDTPCNQAQAQCYEQVSSF